MLQNQYPTYSHRRANNYLHLRDPKESSLTNRALRYPMIAGNGLQKKNKAGTQFQGIACPSVFADSIVLLSRFSDRIRTANRKDRTALRRGLFLPYHCNLTE